MRNWTLAGMAIVGLIAGALATGSTAQTRGRGGIIFEDFWTLAQSTLFIDASPGGEPEIINIIQDKETGCQYFLLSDPGRSAMVPRYTPDGRVYCAPSRGR